MRHVERMIGREVVPRPHIHHRDGQRFRKAHQLRYGVMVSPEVFGENDRPLRADQEGGQTLECGGISGHARRYPRRIWRGQGHVALEGILLKLGVEAQIDRPLGLGHRDAIAASDRGGDAVDGAGLVWLTGT